jgi:hypothetical protein
VIPAGGVTSPVADAALVASIVDAAAAAKTVPMPHARRRFILLVMAIVLPNSRPAVHICVHMRLLSLMLVRVAKVFLHLTLRVQASEELVPPRSPGAAPGSGGADFGMIGAVESSGVARVHRPCAPAA